MYVSGHGAYTDIEAPLRRLIEEKGKGIIINMIFESENYSPIERVDEKLRRRVLDEMGRWDSDAIPAVGGCTSGYSISQSCRSQSGTGSVGAQRTAASPRCGYSNAVTESGAALSGTDEGYTAGCTKNSPSLAMVYSPNQQWGGIYCVGSGLDNGTIFRELNFPFYPTPCRKGAGYCGR